MLKKDVFPHRTRCAIIVIGMIAGLLWAVPDGFNLHDHYSVYLPPLSLTMASILAFTLYRLRDVKPWRDLEINGQRLPVEYYSYEGQ
ncbi:hypothetical protein IFU37_017535 [Pantoea agglomerans]|uniref:hypothetical protein n=1 Tax=Enterobacter agglomerans TaxID=549 RepID=UPI0010C2146E|nr:hypothetical protein [Pantoea agglomerans]MBD8181341.1 hypothetical protein [Pantoea agglomerans]TKJ57786.1 hypothetical protein PagCFBP13505_08865 [Pantoea agglomerans]WVL89387.1 hypothetical protein IFU37_017535 [Pantoea agglomerans]